MGGQDGDRQRPGWEGPTAKQGGHFCTATLSAAWQAGPRQETGPLSPGTPPPPRHAPHPPTLVSLLAKVTVFSWLFTSDRFSFTICSCASAHSILVSTSSWAILRVMVGGWKAPGAGQEVEVSRWSTARKGWQFSRGSTPQAKGGSTFAPGAASA